MCQKSIYLGDKDLPSSEQDLLKLYSHENGRYSYTVEDFFREPKMYDFELSPNGEYISYRRKDYEGKHHVYIKNIKTNKKSIIIEDNQDYLHSYYWANDNNIIFLRDKGENENYHLHSVNIQTKKTINLTPYEGVTVQLLEKLELIDSEVIVLMNKRNSELFEPYKINITTGKHIKLYNNEDSINPIRNYYFDKTGILRAFVRQENKTNHVLLYRLTPKHKFEKVLTTSWEDTFSLIKFNYGSSNPNDAYVLSNIDDDKDEIILYDFKTKSKLKTLFTNKTYDLESLMLSPINNYEIAYYSYKGEKDNIIPVSKRFKKIFKIIKDKFENYNIKIINTTTDEKKYLLKISSDRLFGKYYIFDTTNQEIRLIMDLMPKLEESSMAKMKAISFKSRDGVTIHGYLTLPHMVEDTKVPLIVEPHDLPFGTRDTWSYRSDIQLFASRGYATLQINYRGSGGYGKKFYTSGNKQIGRRMIEDLEDGIKYIEKTGLIDETKIAIYGSSYGGLASLQSLVKTPDLFSCAVDYAGVPSINGFIHTLPIFCKSLLEETKLQWYDSDNVQENNIIQEVSPLYNTDKITKPIFIIQGALDPHVKISETDSLVKRLRRHGIDTPYLVEYNEGHVFHHEKAKIEMYKCMIGFFAEYLK